MNQKSSVWREEGFSEYAMLFLLRKLHTFLGQIPPSPSPSSHTGWIYSAAGVNAAGVYLGDLHKPAVSGEADRELFLSLALPLTIRLGVVLGLCGWQLSR